MVKKRIVSTLQVVLFLAIGLALFWYVLRNQNLSEIKDSLLHANWWWALLSLVFALLSNVLRSARWNMLIHPLDYRPKFMNTFCSVMIGYLFNLTGLRVGEVSRCAVLSRYEKIPVSKLIGTVVVERVVDLISIFAFLFLVIALEFDAMSKLSSQYIFHPLGMKLQSLLEKGVVYYIIVAVVVIAIIVLFWWLTKVFRRSKQFSKIREFFVGFVSGLRTIGHLKNKWWFIFHSVAIWMCYYMMSFVCFQSFEGTEHLGFVAGLAVLVFGGFGFVAPVPGGIGAFEFMVTLTLSTYGVDESTRNGYALFTHSTQTIAVLVFGLLSFPALAYINRKKHHELP